MFYETGNDHGLPYDPFKACVVPRPIGWISTLSPTGTPNLAPYSQFTNLTFDPPYVMFSANRTFSGQRKDSVNNAVSTGVFNWNLATYSLREAVNATAEGVGSEIDEFEVAGLEKEQGKLSKVPLVRASPVKFECAFHSTFELAGNPPMGTVDVVIGRVLGVHVDEKVLTDGKIDVAKTEPIARLGYYEYAVVRESFEMRVPGGDEKMLVGLEGSVRGHRGMDGGKDGVEVGKEEERVEEDEVQGQLKRSMSTGAGD